MRNIHLQAIKNAALELAYTKEEQRNLFLKFLCNELLQNQESILNANKEDLFQAKIRHQSLAFMERLSIGGYGIEKMILRVKEIMKLKDGLGEIIERKTIDDGLTIRKARIPLGVILLIYEARPEVTVDVASLCVKSANAVILKGGLEAQNTNKVLFKCINIALQRVKLPEECVSFIDRGEINRLLKKNMYVDLVIARGGYNLVKKIIKQSSIPVLAHGEGGARIYIDESADLSIVDKVVINAKTSKPSACNSLDTVLVHRKVASVVIPKLVAKLKRKSVRIIGDSDARKIVAVDKADKKDWDTEFLGLTLSLKIVDDVREAVMFIRSHSKRHSEGIIALDEMVIDYFVKSLDSAAIFINSSTRLHDGYVFGLGAEMGIATGKLHARGPVGLKELTTYKWIIEGKGHIRQ